MTQIKSPIRASGADARTRPAETEAWFFGYGSLVNRATHGYAKTAPARLTGWRRVWRHTRLRPVAWLTVVPDAGCTIDGLIAAVPASGQAALDERERAYDRIAADHQIAHALPHTPPIILYAIPAGRHCAPDRAGPVLLSYIDVVVQGYLHEFGEAGARRFFETTDGWDAPVLDDRAAPRYPRHCRLNPDERGLVDDMLRACGVCVVAAG